MTTGLTIGDLSGLIQLAKSGVAGLNITDFDALFDKIKELMRAFNQLTPELEANLDLARQELKANPELFSIGKAEFVNSVDALLAKYPASTPLADIPEFHGGTTAPPTGPGTGTGTGAPGDIDFAKLEKLFADVSVKYDPVTHKVTVVGAGYEFERVGVERLEFKDGFLAFDTDGHAGQVYRLYEAFGRAGEAQGLGYWIKALDSSQTDLPTIAKHFIASNEFTSIFGNAQTLSNSDFVSALYTKIFDRAPDAPGLNYWINALASGAQRDQVFVAFTESAEIQSLVAADVKDGIWYV